MVTLTDDRYKMIDMYDKDTTSDWSGVSCNLKKIPKNNEQFDTSNLTTMVDMFWHCREVEHIDLSTFDTRKVTSMGNMFNSCYELQELDLSTFDTSNVESFGFMFNNCYKLSKITGLEKLNTSKAHNLSGVFNGCGLLDKLDLSTFDTSNAITMDHLFDSCFNLTKLRLSNWDTSKVEYKPHMIFDRVKDLEMVIIPASKKFTIADFIPTKALKTLVIEYSNDKEFNDYKKLIAAVKINDGRVIECIKYEEEF